MTTLTADEALDLRNNPAPYSMRGALKSLATQAAISASDTENINISHNKPSSVLKKGHPMAFVNEYIPKEDLVKYGIEEIDKRFIVGGTRARDWTIDRERDIHLRNVSNGREEFSNVSGWIFYWRGELLYVQLILMNTGGGRGEAGWAHYKLERLACLGSPNLTPSLQERRDQIIADLKEALTAYKDGGVFSTKTSNAITLDL